MRIWDKRNRDLRMSGGGLWGAYNRLSKGTRLRLGVAGILFSVLGIVASPGTSSRFAFFGLMMLGCRDCGSQYFQNIAGFMCSLRLAQRNASDRMFEETSIATSSSVGSA